MARLSPAERRRPPRGFLTPPACRWRRHSQPCTTRTKRSSRPKHRDTDASVHRLVERERHNPDRAAAPSSRYLSLHHGFAELPHRIPIGLRALKDKETNAVPGIVSDQVVLDDDGLVVGDLS